MLACAVTKKSDSPFAGLEKLRDQLPAGSAPPPVIAKGPARAVVRLERKHRGGKEVTVVEKLGLAPAELGTATPGTVWLISDVTEEQLHEVQKGERVNIAFQAFPGAPVSGRAEAIGDVVDPATRTVKVRITAPNPKGRILPGMFARVDFGDPTSGVVPLPASAVVTVEGKDYVFVESSPGEFQRRRVLLVSSDANRVIVGKGLDNGERVVTSGAMLLKGLSFGY